MASIYLENILGYTFANIIICSSKLIVWELRGTSSFKLWASKCELWKRENGDYWVYHPSKYEIFLKLGNDIAHCEWYCPVEVGASTSFPGLFPPTFKGKGLWTRLLGHMQSRYAHRPIMCKWNYLMEIKLFSHFDWLVLLRRWQQ